MEIIKNISFEDYHEKDGISNSMLNEIHKSPAHFKLNLESEKKETEALTFGSLIHCLVLEPNNFERDFAVEPIVNKRTNDGKMILEQFYLQNTNKTIVNEQQLSLAITLKEKVMQHEIARKLLNGKGDNEISLFWTDEETGVKCKCRIDRIKNNILIDLKSTTDASPDAFCKSAYKYGYHRQSYWYSNGYEQCFKQEPKGFVFIVVEKEPPYNVEVYQATELFKKIGELEVRPLLKTYKTCLETNNWYGYSEKASIRDLEIPQWVVNKYMEEIE